MACRSNLHFLKGPNYALTRTVRDEVSRAIMRCGPCGRLAQALGLNPAEFRDDRHGLRLPADAYSTFACGAYSWLPAAACTLGNSHAVAGGGFGAIAYAFAWSGNNRCSARSFWLSADPHSHKWFLVRFSQVDHDVPALARGFFSGYGYCVLLNHPVGPPQPVVRGGRLRRRLTPALGRNKSPRDCQVMKNSYVTPIAVAIGTILSTAAVRPAVAQHTPMSPDATVMAYCQAWGTADRAARDRLLTKVWAPDGIYIDPEPTVAKGRAALSDAIATFQRNYGGHFRCSTPQVHHQAMRVSWVLIRPDGTQRIEGTDFGELAADGRIRRIVGFFGPPPAVSP